MESYSFPKSRIIQNILLVSLLLNPGCSKEDEPPTNGTHDTKATKTIGTSGGTIEIDSFSVTIPPGAFRNDQTLEISVSDKQHPFLDQEVTGLFSVKGIPEEFLEPIILTLKYDGILEEESYLAFGTEQVLEESDTTVINFDLLDCTDSSGYLVGTLSPPGQNNNVTKRGGALKGEQRDIPEELVSLIKGVTDFKTYKAPNSRFNIKYPASLVMNPRFLSLTEYLDLNYLILMVLINQANFGSQIIIPEKVNLFDNRKTSNSNGNMPYFYSGTHNKYAEPGIPDNEYFDYTLYKDPVEEKELNIKIGTTFFKSFQRYVYYDRNKRTQGNPDWFSSASKLWIEEKFCEPWESIENYVPDLLNGNELTPFEAWKSRPHNGMVPAVKYLVETYGEGVVFIYHYHIWQRKSLVEALKLVTGIPLENWFPEFLKDYLEGKIYDVSGDLFAEEVTAQHDLPSLNDPQSYPENYDDLAAKMFLFNTEKISSNRIGVTFSLESQEVNSSKTAILIFSINRGSNEIEFIAEYIRNEVDIYNIKDLSDQNKNLLAVVVNSDYHTPPTTGSGITLKVELNDSLPLTYKKFSVDLNHFTGDIHYEDGNVKTFDNIHMRMYMPDAINGKFTGNKFEAKWDEPLDVFNKDSGHVVAPITEKEGKLELNGFYFHKVSENSDVNSRYSYRLMGGNIPLFMVEGTGMLAGRVEGIDIDNKLSLFGWEVKLYDEDHSLMDGSYKITNIRFRPESYLEVYFYEPN